MKPFFRAQLFWLTTCGDSKGLKAATWPDTDGHSLMDTGMSLLLPCSPSAPYAWHLKEKSEKVLSSLRRVQNSVLKNTAAVLVIWWGKYEQKYKGNLVYRLVITHVHQCIIPVACRASRWCAHAPIRHQPIITTAAAKLLPKKGPQWGQVPTPWACFALVGFPFTSMFWIFKKMLKTLPQCLELIWFTLLSWIFLWIGQLEKLHDARTIRAMCYPCFSESWDRLWKTICYFPVVWFLYFLALITYHFKEEKKSRQSIYKGEAYPKVFSSLELCGQPEYIFFHPPLASSSDPGQAMCHMYLTYPHSSVTAHAQRVLLQHTGKIMDM